MLWRPDAMRFRAICAGAGISCFRFLRFFDVSGLIPERDQAIGLKFRLLSLQFTSEAFETGRKMSVIRMWLLKNSIFSKTAEIWGI